MARTQYRGVIVFDFEVDGNLQDAAEVERLMKMSAEKFVDIVQDGSDLDYDLSGKVRVTQTQAEMTPRRGDTGPISKITFRGGRGENAKMSPAQIDRLKTLIKKIETGMQLDLEERKRYITMRKKAQMQDLVAEGIITHLPELGKPMMEVSSGESVKGMHTFTVKLNRGEGWIKNRREFVQRMRKMSAEDRAGLIQKVLGKVNVKDLLDNPKTSTERTVSLGKVFQSIQKQEDDVTDTDFEAIWKTMDFKAMGTGKAN